MESFSILHAGAVLGGLLLTAAIAGAIYKFAPPPYRNLFFGFIALGMFAVGTGSKLDLSWKPEEGLLMKVAELEKTIDGQRAQIAALEKKGVPTEEIVTLLRNQEQDVKKLLNKVAYLDTTVEVQRQQVAELKRGDLNAQKILASVEQLQAKAFKYDLFWKTFSEGVKVVPESYQSAYDPNESKKVVLDPKKLDQLLKGIQKQQ